MAFANQARIDVAGIYNRFSSLERRAIDGEKCHLSTSTRGPIFYMETPGAWSRARFRARMSQKEGANYLGIEPANLAPSALAVLT
jgi:hypothetical protein